jgi:ArsR family transcriptional regulator, lead/cadmium/zinc/bismuth-responsive transcriptional repressor
MTSDKKTRATLPDAHCGPDEHVARGAKQSVVGDDALERAAGLFRAAGDVSRLRLLGLLADGEWCVTELAEAVGAGLSTISQQLRLLRSERIVRRRRSGRHIYYSLADAHVIDLVKSALDHAAEHPIGDEDDE